MGEYFNGHKLGTCNHLMYVTREELELFAGEYKRRNQSEGNLLYLQDYLNLESRFIYRFPRRGDVVSQLKQIDDRTEYGANLEINMPVGFKVPHRDHVQVTINSIYGGRALTYNMNFCPADADHFDKMVPVNLCGWKEEPKDVYSPIIEAVGVKYTPTHPDGYTIFRCPICDMWFACDESECKTIRSILHDDGLWFEEKHIKPYYPERDK